MSPKSNSERSTQQNIVSLFKDTLGYTYLGNWQKRENSNIEEELLTDFLKESGYTDGLIVKAIYELQKVAHNQSQTLYDANKAVYSLLRYGIAIKEELGQNSETVSLINWKEPLKNHFAIAEEVTVIGQNSKRPDIVLYINGIPIGVLELKKSTVSVSEGIRQDLDNQKKEFIQHFFTTIQLVMAGNETEYLRYGTIETDEKYYLTWKEDKEALHSLEEHISKLCNKERIIELFKDFIVFDRGQKKLCRPNQFFGVKAAQENIRKREGGIIWHTQGSGKSLTMVWLTKWIRKNIDNARVLIITDRDELDKQIEKVFKGVDENIYRTKNGADLIHKLHDTKPWLLCSLIHKFGKKEEETNDKSYEEYIKELKNSLPSNFEAKGDLYVFVDECHRTQSGKLHKAMSELLPNAVLIGFTGTPLLKKDKQKSIEVFGTYIHTYKFDEAVKDKVVLDLRYEARKIDQDIKSQKRIDEWFDSKTKKLSDVAKMELKQRWGTMQKVLSSKERLAQIVSDIVFDMAVKDRLQNGRGNAMLVSGSIYQACKYYELFQQTELKDKCAVVTSYKPSPNDIKGETTKEGLTEKLKQYEIYNQMLNGKSPEVFEDEVKAKFIDEPAQMKLLIVVDKLLTGFDAPSATYLYIDKKMKDHGLFQAVCRVNRLDSDDKEYGYIIDYEDLFGSLEKSIKDYTSEIFDTFNKEDVEGLLKDRLDKGRERLDDALEALHILCEPVTSPKGIEEFKGYFVGEGVEVDDNQQKRKTFYRLVSKLIRAYANVANEMDEIGYSIDEQKAIKKEAKEYEEIRQIIKLASADYIDLKMYEPAMRHLIDTYIGASESEKISAFDNMTLIQLIVERRENFEEYLPSNIKGNKESIAEIIENNVRKVVNDERLTNPKYFDKMSVLLEELVDRRKQKSIEYEAYLKEIIQITSLITNPSSNNQYPKSINAPLKRAFYDELNENETLALEQCH